MYLKKLYFLVLITIILILYGTCTEFPVDALPGPNNNLTPNPYQSYDAYAIFTGIHVMIFIGFGFLMVFLKTHSWTAVGFNYLASAYVILIAILFRGFWMGAFSQYKKI